MYIRNWISWIKILYQLLILSIISLSFGFLFCSLILSAASSFFSSHSLILSVAIASFFLIKQMKSEKKKKKKEKREKRETCSWAKELIKTKNTKQNPILKIKLNQNKQIWKKKKKKKKGRFDPSQLVGRTTRGGGDACGGGPSLSLSLWCEALEWSWGEKENKKKGVVCLVWRRKTRKEKRKKEMKRGWKWNERKKNNIKSKKS